MLLKTLGPVVLIVFLAASGCKRQTETVATPNHWAEGSLATVSSGHYDDQDQRVEYKGKWWSDHQFPESSGQSITYSDKPGDTFRIAFTGSAITYVFTRALNRGIAEVRVDAAPAVRINQYSGPTKWQEKQRFSGLSAGTHTMEVRVSEDKDPVSGGLFVDLDAFEVEP
jgi:hypothetical protein